MPEKPDVPQGTLALMVLKTLDLPGPLLGYGIARRIQQISGWGTSRNIRRARFYRLTRAGHKQLRTETRDRDQTAAIIARFFAVKAEHPA
jgi:PadR family transcriptional regulator, regulatory protein PadR